MKKILFILSLVFVFIACNNDDGQPVNQNDLFGKWQLFRTYSSDGGDFWWTDIENGYIYEFRTDQSLISNRFGCDGTFQVQAENLTIDFDCNETQFNSHYGFAFENGYLFLSDPLCDEGCVEVFKRLE